MAWSQSTTQIRILPCHWEVENQWPQQCWIHQRLSIRCPYRWLVRYYIGNNWAGHRITEKKEPCSRVCFLTFLVSGDPLHVLFIVSGNKDPVRSYPSVGVSDYTKLISVLAFFIDCPLQPMRWALTSERGQKPSHVVDGPGEVGKLFIWFQVSDTDEGVAVDERDDLVKSSREVEIHWDFYCNMKLVVSFFYTLKIDLGRWYTDHYLTPPRMGRWRPLVKIFSLVRALVKPDGIRLRCYATPSSF